MRPKRGVFGIFTHQDDCLDQICKAIAEQQHRGSKFWGVAISSEEGIICRTGHGLVSRDIREFSGNLGIGHTSSADPQPIVRDSIHGQFAVCFDGFNPDAENQKAALMAKGSPFVSKEDIEVLASFINFGFDAIDGIESAARLVVGPCAMLVLTRNALYATRDPQGWRPLVLGKNDQGACAVASEPCVFGSRFQLVRDVLPGEVVRIDHEGIQSIRQFANKPLYCIQEWLHFSRVDSLIDSFEVAAVRNAIGQKMAKRGSWPKIDMISPVPFAAFTYTEGIQLVLKVPVMQAFHRPHYDGHYSVIPPNVLGQRILLVDNLIRSGQTLKRLVADLRQAGAKKVFVAIAAPPVREDCRYNSQADETFLAVQYNDQEICQAIGADGFSYLPITDLRAVFGNFQENICSKCLER